MASESILLVFTTVATEQDATQLIRVVLHAKLAVCAQLSPIRSAYEWRGELNFEQEYQLLFKTRSNVYAALADCILAHHPYDLPALYAIDSAQVHTPFLQWVTEGVVL